MQRPTKGNDSNDGGQNKKAVLLSQGCVQLEVAVQSFYPVMQYSSQYLGLFCRSQLGVRFNAINALSARPWPCMRNEPFSSVKDIRDDARPSAA